MSILNPSPPSPSLDQIGLELNELQSRFSEQALRAGEPSRYEPKTILPRHRRMIELYLDGHKMIDIARWLDCSPQLVQLILKSEKIQRELSLRQEQRTRKGDEILVNRLSLARETLEHASLEAAEKLHSQIDHEDPRVAQKACENILNFSLGKSRSEEGTGMRIELVSIERLQLIQTALVESGVSKKAEKVKALPTPIQLNSVKVEEAKTESELDKSDKSDKIDKIEDAGCEQPSPSSDKA